MATYKAIYCPFEEMCLWNTYDRDEAGDRFEPGEPSIMHLKEPPVIADVRTVSYRLYSKKYFSNALPMNPEVVDAISGGLRRMRRIQTNNCPNPTKLLVEHSNSL